LFKTVIFPPSLPAVRWSYSTAYRCDGCSIIKYLQLIDTVFSLNNKASCIIQAGRGAMREITFKEALNEALRQNLERDERVFVMGEDVGIYGGVFSPTEAAAIGVFGTMVLGLINKRWLLTLKVR